MRIGIITIVKVNNYGAELQAFATQKKMEMMGYDVEVIDYLYYKDWHFNDTAMAQPLVKMNGKDKLMYFFKYRIAAFLVDKVMPLINDNVKNVWSISEIFIVKILNFHVVLSQWTTFIESI